MKPKIEETVLQEDWDIFVKVRAILEGLPKALVTSSIIFGVRMPRTMMETTLIPNCHVFTRALAKFLPVDVHDGMLVETRSDGTTRRHEHSWLTRTGSNGRAIIDPWPLGSVTGPALFIQDYGLHFGHECCFLEHRSRDFLHQVAALRLEIRKVMERRRIPNTRVAA